jgi:hypothetical protein
VLVKAMLDIFLILNNGLADFLIEIRALGISRENDFSLSLDGLRIGTVSVDFQETSSGTGAPSVVSKWV